MKRTFRTLTALAKYRQTLPPNEVAAIEAWASTFYRFQQEWLFDDSEEAIQNKSRQIGTSHTTSAVLTRWGAFHGQLTTIISIGEREAKEVLEKSRRHAWILRKLGSKMAEVGKTDNANELTFASGGRIIALPASAGRGFTGNVFLDEFAYYNDPDKVWDAASPVTLLPGYKLRVVSTPNGAGNAFHRLWRLAREKGTGWSTHEIPIDVAIKDGYPVDLKKCWKLAKGDPRLFDQMFRCSFLDNELQYIPTELIERAQSEDDLTKSPGDVYYAGLDIGRENDLSVLLILRYHRGICTVVHVESMRRTEFDKQEEAVDRAFAHYNIRRLCIDQTGLGRGPAERIKKKHSERIDIPSRRPRVELIDFTLPMKERLATGLHSWLTTGRVVLPKNDAALPPVEIDGHTINKPGTAQAMQEDIASIRRVITKAGNVTYDAPRTSDGHADHAWALALALHAATGVNPMLDALRRASGR